ncbi:IucA/IucC family protein [Enterobacterales bacterium CwR94]|nr:IucA/IucC family protein [Enterobacterales bacterium CwR94]
MRSLQIDAGNMTQHLTAENWSWANRHLVTKILRELIHEKVLPVQALESSMWEVVLEDVCYRFRATPFLLEHWQIESASIEKTCKGVAQPLDAQALLIELGERREIPEKQFPVYLEEVASTLYGHAFKQQNQPLTAQQLTQASYQEVETAMREGHPVFIANNGRIGFDAQDYLRYAPESAAAVSLNWIAVSKQKARFVCDDELSYAQLMASELGEFQLARFKGHLHSLGLDDNDYWLMPIHPWQWQHKIAINFAGDIAAAHIVWLGEGNDCYLAQQSIRTFFNITAPHRYYVKTALSVLNMGFMRGLDPHSMLTTPQVNSWLYRTVSEDVFFQSKGFKVLRERAAIGYFHEGLEQAITKDSPWKKMLSALWRESPMSLLKPEQRLMTMASLLHVDGAGDSVVAALINDSGLDAQTWVERYLDAYMSPILHAFFHYDLVFMPHGENLMLVLENNAPVNMLMKDIGEEIALLNSTRELPKDIAFLHVTVEDDMKINYILLDLFDCFFRYLSPLLATQAGLPETQFWNAVARCVWNYQSQHPQLADKYRQFNLFKPAFVRTCLNRLQMANNQQMIDLDDREKNLKFAGTLDNPLYPLRKEYSVTYQPE